VLGGSILRLVLGFLTDYIGPKLTAQIGMVLTVIPLVLGWQFVHSLDQLYIVAILLGIAGASFAAALPLAGQWYSKEHQGLAMGIAGAGNSGTIFSTLFANRLAQHFGGWEAVFGLALIPIVLVFIFFTIFAKNSPNRPAPKKLTQYGSLLKQRDVGGTRMLTVLYAVAGLMLASISTLPPLPVVIVLLFIGMMSLGMGNGSVFQLVPQRFGNELGLMTGIVGAAGGIGGYVLPLILGKLYQSSGAYTAGFLVLSGIALAALITLYVIQFSWRKQWMGKGGKALIQTSGEGTTINL
ncbi:MFS transporter, partial [Paenibacillus sp. MCAF20]